MSDLAEARWRAAYYEAATRITEQAEEIERLRAALRSIAANTCCEGCQEAARVARAAITKGGAGNE